MAINIGLCDVVSSEGHIRSVPQELWHPEHVATGGVEKGDTVLAQESLDLVHDRVEDVDHVAGVLGVAPDPAGGFSIIICPPPLASIDSLKTFLSGSIILFFLQIKLQEIVV